MTYILPYALIFAIALTPLGYMVYRAHRIAMIERMGRQLHNETGGYSLLESAVLAAKCQSIERTGRDLPYVSMIDGKQRVCQCCECLEAMKDFQPMHVSPPLVEPSPNAFPLHYCSPTVEPAGPRLLRIPGTDTWAYGYQPSFHFGDKVEVTGGLYWGSQGKVTTQRFNGDDYWVRLENGHGALIEKQHLRLVTIPPQSVSAMIPYHATLGEHGPDLGTPTHDVPPVFVDNLRDALEKGVISVQEAREMLHGEHGPDDSPISPYAQDELYEPMKEWAE